MRKRKTTSTNTKLLLKDLTFLEPVGGGRIGFGIEVNENKFIVRKGVGGLFHLTDYIVARLHNDGGRIVLTSPRLKNIIGILLHSKGVVHMELKLLFEDLNLFDTDGSHVYKFSKLIAKLMRYG